MPNVNLDTNMPSRPVAMHRTYTNVVFDASTSLMVATSIVMNKFNLFDDEGNKTWEPDGAQLSVCLSFSVLSGILAPNINYPHTETSTLEIFPTDFSSVMDG